MKHAIGVSALSVIVALGCVAVANARPAATPAGFPSASRQYCTPALGVTFTWTSSGDGPQWLDLSLADNGFAPGTFVSVGPLAAGVAQFDWVGLAMGRVHFVRVNTLTAAGWQASPTASFVTGVCAGPSPAQLGAVIPYCNFTTLLGGFNWTPSQPSGLVQWLDLSTYNNDFAPGTFVLAGPLSGDANSFTWTGLLANQTHFWRVNTWTDATWVTSGTGSFTTGYCQPAPLPPPLPIPLPGPAPTGGAEWVSVSRTFSDSGGDEVIVFRANGEEWLLNYGVGCIELDLYEGRSVLVTSPTSFFAGIGSNIVIPDANESCIIWDSSRIG